MKRFALSILFAGSLITLATTQTQAQPQTQTQAQAQPQDTTQPQPGPKRPATERAVRQLKTLEKRLQLSQDQVLQLQVILIHKDIAMDSLRNNASGDRRTDNRARRSVQQDADAKIDAMLTEQQRTLYQQWKQEQREKAAKRKQPDTQ